MTVRWLGTFLDDPLNVPASVLELVAGQLDAADPLQANKYGERAARSWTSGDGPKAIFLDAIAWMRGRKILPPGVSRLARLVAGSR